jgi:hypothetical protein
VDRPLARVTGALVTLVALGACGGPGAAPPPAPPPVTAAPGPSVTPTPVPTATPAAPPPRAGRPELPLGGRSIFPEYRVVAYYGTAGAPVLGVLGESSPEGILPRLRAAARAFGAGKRKVQVAYELIATVAQAAPGADRDYSKPIDPAKIARYVDAARRHKVLVILDVQPGRSDFLSQVRALRPHLEQPHVGLALDPEWRMGPKQVPGRAIGSVTAAEVNEVSAYLADIVRRHDLPEKLFLLHQFRSSMIEDIGQVRRRPGLAMVQHVDGFGTRRQKDATFAALRRPDQFHLGYKLFYDEDVRMYGPRDVLAMRPTPEYISYQ